MSRVRLPVRKAAYLVTFAATIVLSLSLTTPAFAATPVNTSPPVVSGTPQQDNTLTTSTGAWKKSPASYTYAWQRCDSSGASCSSISGATTSSYTLQAADVGHTIKSVVQACNSKCRAAFSAPTAVVTASGSTCSTFPAPLKASGRNIVDPAGCVIGGPGKAMRGYSVQISSTTVYQQSDFNAMKASGASYVRFIVHWQDAESTQGTFDAAYESAMDAEISEATAAGLYSYLTLYFTNNPPSWCSSYTNDMACYMATGKFITQTLANRYGNPTSTQYSKAVMGWSINEPPINGSSTTETTLTNDWNTILTNWVRASGVGNAPSWIGFIATAYTSATPIFNDCNAGWCGTQDNYANFDPTTIAGGNVVLDVHDYIVGDVHSSGVVSSATPCPNNPCDGRAKWGGITTAESGGWALKLNHGYTTYPFGETRTQAQSDLNTYLMPAKDESVKYNIPLMIGETGWPDNMTSGESSFVPDQRAAIGNAGAAMFGLWDYSKSSTDVWATFPGGVETQGTKDFMASP
jgi:hypothetical protein